jgi:signal transduction histidine kinase
MSRDRGLDWAALVRQTFEYSSGRVIALTRFVLAAVFFLALWLDPLQPVRASTFGYALLGGYLLLASGLLGLSWRNWWWDHRLAWPALAIDVSALLAAVFITEGAADDFTSPFLAFFAFVMLSATIRWDWRMTVAAGLTVTLLYLAVGSYIATIDANFDVIRFGRRIVYMLVLTLVLAWFGLQRREQSIRRFVELPEQPHGKGAMLDQALRYATAECDARCAAIAWADYEEPYVRVRAQGFELPSERLGPEELDAETGFSRVDRLFDRDRKRSLVARAGSRPVARSGPVEDAFAEYCAIDEGIALQLAGLTGRGELLLSDIDGVGADHVQLGGLIAREISAAFDRHATLALASETAVARMRDSLARDLHDSVAQSLAGAALRLEGLRGWIRDGGDPESEIDAMKHSLREEQRHVRSLIARLRLGPTADDWVEAGAAIRTLLATLSGQWGVAARLAPSKAAILVPGWLAHEMAQVLREAVANAVRHGQAARVEVGLHESDGGLVMTIDDNGRGFPDGDPDARPWSINERVDKLAGRLSVATGPRGTRLEIVLPVGTGQ